MAYGTMYGVKRTTIYLTDGQKQELELLSARVTRTESDLIREGVDQVLESHRPGSRKPGRFSRLTIQSSTIPIGSRRRSKGSVRIDPGRHQRGAAACQS